MFILAIATSTLGYVLYASCQNIASYMVCLLPPHQTYLLTTQVAGIFEAIGSTGYALTQQVFVADVTNLINRGIWSTLPDSLTTIPTLYLGTLVAERILEHSTWRWGWGMWAIILPVCAAPLIGTMLVYQHRLAARNPKPAAAVREHKDPGPWYKRVFNLLWFELDLPGGVLLVLGLSLLLIPLSLTGANNSNAWHKGNFIAMLVLGVVFLISFVVWDAWFARKPFVPYRMIRNRTVAAACILGALDFFHYSVFSVFFPSYLQVAAHFSPGKATRVESVFPSRYPLTYYLHPAQSYKSLT